MCRSPLKATISRVGGRTRDSACYFLNALQKLFRQFAQFKTQLQTDWGGSRVRSNQDELSHQPEAKFRQVSMGVAYLLASLSPRHMRWSFLHSDPQDEARHRASLRYLLSRKAVRASRPNDPTHRQTRVLTTHRTGP